MRFFVLINVFLCNGAKILTILTTNRRHAPVYGFSTDIKLLTLKLIEAVKLYVMNSFINMKGCSSNNITRNLIQ